MRAAAIESPCQRLCTIHPTARICEGCGRTLGEIGGWLTMTPEDRRRVMALLPDRLKALGAPS
ncbi:DUF1289 domain-containing protein [Phreatobacter aquaticus]|uniref:DUF1289 domain-containing protein n=1 Tax=Phreatobacter aquaticus TaxID=2570229 RepID=A0A4D7QN36_9HYPH|nr:DUF1289 domain-containing protein [Phreatobacter aquaticus]QCK86684.1 DUF1289 domain-containing protein [Phreatobacter aquaticus]